MHTKALQGTAAMLLSFDVEADVVHEHDHWHTHEHLPERLSIPGFRRGTRWICTGDGPRYMVLYEVQSLQTLSSPAYLERLNNPTPWTTKMMLHYRGMQRGLCSVLGSAGIGQGGVAALIRFTPDRDRADSLSRWLLDAVLAQAAQKPGLGSAHLLQGAQAAVMTNEQRIRGADRGVDMALILTGYDADAVATEALKLCGPGGLPDRGATEPVCHSYRSGYSVARDDLAA